MRRALHDHTGHSRHGASHRTATEPPSPNCLRAAESPHRRTPYQNCTCGLFVSFLVFSTFSLKMTLGAFAARFMSKMYKGKLCTYCVDRPSVSADHVFAREFFLVRHRMDLPKVPSCDRCQKEKAELEHYLTTVLPFGGRHPDATENLTTMVPKRLRNNTRLNRTLAQGRNPVWVREGDLVVPSSTLPIDCGAFQMFFNLIAKGLTWYHWRTHLTAQDFVEVWTLTDAGARPFDEWLAKANARERVRRNLGNGTFVYEGAQGIDCPQVTIWYIWPYGGVHVSDNSRNAERISSRVTILTGPQSVKQSAQLASKLHSPSCQSGDKSLSEKA